ncbi:unnamed protein product [Soboliphyme baturini]|uniref:F-box domain-containing protein n=1 Tax=Soboliphyme baturini TaxID=241478 RepID=A0A183JA52_9BILA|nr:unnamed protein product [Soboliphyme baturini]
MEQEQRVVECVPPQDCLLIVFNLLSLEERIRVERVCKGWRGVSLASFASVRSFNVATLWKDDICDTDLAHSILLEGTHAVLLRCGKYLR